MEEGMEGHHHIESGGHTLKYNFWDNAAKPLVFCNLDAIKCK